MDCGEIVRGSFEDILWFFCTRKFHGVHGGMRCGSSLVLPLAHRKEETLQDGSEVLRRSLLMAGYIYEEVLITEGLPAVGVTAKSRALPFQAGIVVGWHPSSHRKAFRREVLG